MFDIFYIDGKPLQQNKNYYRNILVKIKDKETIYSLGCILLQIENEFKISYKFYKIYSFENNNSLEYIDYILTKKFPLIFYNTDGFSSKSSYYDRCLEHIKGYYLIPRLRKYLFFVIFTRILLMIYKFFMSLPKKIYLILNTFFKNL